MPVLYAFYNDGAMKRKIREEDLYRSFQEFYANPANGVDMKRDKSTQNYKKWAKKEYVSLARRNPLKFLEKTHGDWFYWQEDAFCIHESIEAYQENKVFLSHFKDVLEYRTRRYYKERLEEKYKELEDED